MFEFLLKLLFWGFFAVVWRLILMWGEFSMNDQGAPRVAKVFGVLSYVVPAAILILGVLNP